MDEYLDMWIGDRLDVQMIGLIQVDEWIKTDGWVDILLDEWTVISLIDTVYSWMDKYGCINSCVVILMDGWMNGYSWMNYRFIDR